MEKTGLSFSFQVVKGSKNSINEPDNSKLNLWDHLKKDLDFHNVLRDDDGDQRIKDEDEDLSTLVENYDPSRRPSLLTSVSSTTLVDSSNEFSTPVSFANGKHAFLDELEGDEQEDEELEAIGGNIQLTPERSEKDFMGALRSNMGSAVFFDPPQSLSQQIFQVRLSQEEAYLPSRDRYLNLNHASSELVEVFHFSDAERLSLPLIKKYQPPMFSGVSFQTKAVKGKGSKAWIEVSEHTETRWSQIYSRLLETESVPEYEVELFKRVFTSPNRLLKLQILANNQILGAGNFVTSTYGLPFQETESGNLAIELKTSSGFATDSNNEGESKLFKHGLYFNLRHIILREGDMTLSNSSSPNTSKSFHVKRPLNSYMLYRSSMMRVSTLLKLLDSMTEIVQEVLQNYKEGIANESFSLKDQEFYVLSRFNDIINNPDERKATIFVDLLNERLYRCERVKHSSLGQIISLLWQTENSKVKGNFHQFSKIETAVHLVNNPGYKYKPSKKQKH